MDAQQYAASRVALLTPPVLSDEGTREMLLQFFRVVAEFQVAELDPLGPAARTLLGPDCPDASIFDDAGLDTGLVALDGLLSNLGFSRALDWYGLLDEAMKRKVATLATALWKIKGTPDAARALYRVLSGGQDLVDWSWDFWRLAIEDGAACGPVLALDDTGAGGPWETSLHLSDPLHEVDRDLVARALRSLRAASDSWALVWTYLAEPFLQGLCRWAVAGAPACAVDSGEVVLGVGDVIASATGGESAWDIGRILLSCKRSGTGYGEVRFATVGYDYWRLRLEENAVSVVLVRSGIETVVCAAASGLTADRWYLVDLRLVPLVTGAVRCDVYLDGDSVASGTVS